MITYPIDLCIGSDNREQRITVKCHDTGFNLLVSLFVSLKKTWREEKTPYSIADDSTAVLKIAKPDKTRVLIDGELDNGKFLFKLPPQSFTVAGVESAEVALFSADGRRVTSATFDIEVTNECVCDCEEESADFYDVLGKQVATATTAEKNAVAAASEAAQAAKLAESYLSHPPIIGESGNWCMWDGTKYIDSGTPAAGGGYYTPNIIQVNETTMRISYTPSNENMPTPDAVEIRLPRGQKGADGAPGADGYTPQRGTDYWTETDIAEIKNDMANEGYIKNTDYAAADKGGTVKVINYSSGLSMTSDGKLQIYGAEQSQIREKASYHAPITAKNADYAIAQGTHQDMSDEYDVTTFFTISALANNKGQLPVGYNAVKGYVDKKIGNIDTALDSIIALQNSYIGGESV